ncbi:hypothetical protein M432DRAFT_612456 [Thermoascus aurantiacus ATCC 26904]
MNIKNNSRTLSEFPQFHARDEKETESTTNFGRSEEISEESDTSSTWNAWTDAERGGVIAASILAFMFLCAVSYFVHLKVKKRKRAERRMARRASSSNSRTRGRSQQSTRREASRAGRR